MDRVKKARRPERSAVTKTVTAVEALLVEVPLPKVEIGAQLEALNRHLQKFTELDEKVKKLILDAEFSIIEQDRIIIPVMSFVLNKIYGGFDRIRQ